MSESTSSCGQQDPADRAPDTPVFDFAGGLTRVMGDRILFLQVLERFCKDYRHCGANLRTALANGDHPLARRLTHTLKGAAGMIEARALHRQTSMLEQALQFGNANAANEAHRLEAELGKVLRELDSVLVSNAWFRMEASAAPKFTTAEAPLERLRELLQADDGAALDLVEEASASLAAALGETRSCALAAAVEEFDFARALTLLGEAPSSGR